MSFCKLVDVAIQDEKKGIEFYKKLREAFEREKKTLMPIPEEEEEGLLAVLKEVMAKDAREAIDKIEWEQEEHKKALESLKAKFCQIRK